MSGTVYQPKIPTPILDSSSAAAQGVAFEGTLESLFLGLMIESPNGAESVQHVYRPWKITELQAIIDQFPA